MGSGSQRNQPCACGSGKKFKHCHGKAGDTPTGLRVKQNWDGEELQIGGPGVVVATPMIAKGTPPLESELSKYEAHYDIDLPAHLPLLDDFSVAITTSSGEFMLTHHIKTAGEENFSSIPTDRLPTFSSLKLSGPAPLFGYSIEYLKGPKSLDSAPSAPIDLVVREVIERLNVLLGTVDGPFEKNLRADGLSYRMAYVSRDRTVPSTCLVSVPYSGVLEVVGEDTPGQLTTEQATTILQMKAEVERAVLRHSNSELGFVDRATQLVHDFGFYARQSPKALSELSEEHLRDILLFGARLAFGGGGDAEVFHYDGKLDFKLTNSQNRYEYVTGEFKWWKGPSSGEEALHQALRKHSTAGQEARIFVVILSRNHSVSDVYGKLSSLVGEQQEFIDGTFKRSVAPEGSKEFIGQSRVKLRAAETDLVFSVVDLFHEKQ